MKLVCRLSRSCSFQKFIPKRQLSFNRHSIRIDEDKVVPGLIGLNLIVFGCWASANDRVTRRFMQDNFTISSAGVFRQYKLHTFFTSMFSHQDGFHLFGNMITLYFFGSNAVKILGTSIFLRLYLAGGVFSGLCHVAWPYARQFTGWTPIRRRHSLYNPALGASGAINAIVAWSICMFPTSTIFIYFIPVPAFIAGLLFIGKDLYEIQQEQSSVGNAAHIGGALLGASFFILRRLRR